MITSHTIKTYNNTEFTCKELAEITKQPEIWWYKSNWRGRIVTLYPHPSGDKARCISVGITFDEDMQVICDEALKDHHAYTANKRVLD